MTPSVDAGKPPERSYVRAIFCDLQACISEPARIFHYWTRNIVGGLLNWVNWVPARESARGTGEVGETIKVMETRTAEKESPYDYNQKQSDVYHGIGDGNAGSSVDGDDDKKACHDIRDSGFDYGPQDMADGYYSGSDDGIDRELPPLSHRISYNGDSKNIQVAHSFSQYRVELFTVRPRFSFTGTFVVTDGFSAYYWSSQKLQIYHIVDSQHNLVLHSEGGALTDTFWIKIKILEDNSGADHDSGYFSFTVDPYVCNNVITHTISTKQRRKIDLTFMALHTAIQANVYVNFDFVCRNATKPGTIYYVYGEITAHHQLYDGESVMLFSRGEENKAVVTDGGELPLSRNCAAVPIYLEPLLILKLNLHVPIKCDHDDEDHTIAFRDYIIFYRDEYEKIICSADSAECQHGKVKVRISYQ
ncbi:unnamed protein product [Triticum turgidum subsp. durum]|uniref:DUF6598 domain-containing protein n=1 Tax=Triticum turgidum subsp. durum TaxID=4567 RepID=A0A9R1BA64_TRITD|nr:unnamed protein product [Triticum turgidum subsp. durum]